MAEEHIINAIEIVNKFFIYKMISVISQDTGSNRRRLGKFNDQPQIQFSRDIGLLILDRN